MTGRRGFLSQAVAAWLATPTWAGEPDGRTIVEHSEALLWGRTLQGRTQRGRTRRGQAARAPILMRYWPMTTGMPR